MTTATTRLSETKIKNLGKAENGNPVHELPKSDGNYFETATISRSDNVNPECDELKDIGS